MREISLLDINDYCNYVATCLITQRLILDGISYCSRHLCVIFWFYLLDLWYGYRPKHNFDILH